MPTTKTIRSYPETWSRLLSTRDVAAAIEALHEKAFDRFSAVFELPEHNLVVPPEMRLRDAWRAVVRPHVVEQFRLQRECDDAQHREQVALRERERLANALLHVERERDQFANALRAEQRLCASWRAQSELAAKQLRASETRIDAPTPAILSEHVRDLIWRVRLRLGGHPGSGNLASGAHDTKLVDDIDAMLGALANAPAPKDPLMRVCVVGLVTDAEGRILLIFNPKRGGWELPGGKLHGGEAWRDGLRRELREETGLDVALDNGPPYAVVDGVPLPGASYSSIIIVAHGMADGAPTPGDDASEARWFAPADLPVADLSRIGSASVVRDWLLVQSSATCYASTPTENEVQARVDELLTGPRRAVFDCDGARLREILRSWLASDKAAERLAVPAPMPAPSSRAEAARNEYLRRTGLLFSYDDGVWEDVIGAVDAYVCQHSLNRRARDAFRVLAENIDRGVVSDGVYHAFVMASQAVHAALAGGMAHATTGGDEAMK